MSPRKEKLMSIMVTNPMSFNILTSPTKLKLDIFSIFTEFEKDTENKNPLGPFSYIYVCGA